MGRCGVNAGARGAIDSPPSLDEARVIVAPLIEHLRVETAPADREAWVDRAALCDPATGPMADLHARFVSAGFGPNRRAAAASLLLRHGWASGYIVASWLAYGLVARIDDYALKFSKMTLVEGIWIKAGRIEQPMSKGAGRIAVARHLRRFTHDVVEAQHAWSRMSRHALWAMATSSWAAQFVSIGEKMNCRDAAVEEARAIIALDRETRSAAPTLYEVAGVAGSTICQRRAACCLYFKGPWAQFCASRPIIPPADRLIRNRAWANASATERVA